MLTGLGALLRPALSYVLPLFWVLGFCVALTIGMFAWCTVAGWIAVAVSCLIVELRADMEPRRKQAARRG
ncbi:MAG TPA: hypothetical protein VGL02_18110 [Streptomyces sp.]